MLQVVMKSITQTAADKKFVQAKQYTEISFYIYHDKKTNQN